MTRKAISARPRAMGRESLGVKQVLVWLFEEQPDRIDALVAARPAWRVLHVAYEAMLADPEVECRRIGAFLGAAGAGYSTASANPTACPATRRGTCAPTRDCVADTATAADSRTE